MLKSHTSAITGGLEGIAGCGNKHSQRVGREIYTVRPQTFLLHTDGTDIRCCEKREVIEGGTKRT